MKFCRYCLPLICVLLTPLTVHALSLNPFDKSVPYDIDLEGDDTLKKTLRAKLDEQRSGYTDEDFKSVSKLAFNERQTLKTILKSLGYYTNSVKTDVREEKIIYRIVPGAMYHISKISTNLPDPIKLPEGTLTLKSGANLVAADVLDNRKAINSAVENNFCLYNVQTDYQVTLNHETQTANISYTVKPSPSVVFGPIEMTGYTTINEDYLRERLTFKEGECFRRAAIDASRLALVQTNLVASVGADVGQPDNGVVPIRLRIIERKHRTITAGTGFQSDEGFGVSAGWENRNLWGEGETLSVDAMLADRIQSLSTSLTFPHFHREDQALNLYAEGISEDTDAYDSDSATAGVMLARKMGRYLRGAVGTEITFSDVVEKPSLDEDQYLLLSLPVTLDYDRRNDPLDPRRGFSTSVSVRPYWDAKDTSRHFLKSAFSATSYLTAKNMLWSPTFAVRAALGSITGATVEDVPANIRFYSGGGGSVRGYPYQTLGPLTGDDPDGGLSLTEVSFETRLHWGESWGGVWFIDGGYAYESELPGFDEDLLWSTGFGIRFYTGFAPIRFDVGFPLDKREDVDNDFEVYISIGQAY